MKTRSVIFWLILLPASMTGCSQDIPDPIDDAACGELIKQLPNHDAIEWFKTPTAEPKLHGSMSDAEALALALRFQQLGAERLVAFEKRPLVGLPKDPSFANDIGMVVQVPLDPTQRMAIFELYAKHERNLGFAPKADKGQRYLYIRWPEKK